jgi:hypothetical protein
MGMMTGEGYARKMVMVCFKILSQHLPGVTEENTETPQ